eukprot:TRINITY_DN22158_c0_g1_i1.p1 TRINITY_DN22158_c0_g1~~TRINITY_DN22158_c0_g1_i1.p1  ORF type:complete len:117 (+),score=33.48 TRINITY_DN22158_c0_g1_i1:83-433(+)
MLELSESLSSCSKEEKTTLCGLFDRETRRERTLELLEKEQKLKEKNKRGMKNALTMMRSLGMQNFTKKAHQQTPGELLNKERLDAAEENFFSLIKAEKERRLNEGKPSSYSDDPGS